MTKKTMKTYKHINLSSVAALSLLLSCGCAAVKKDQPIQPEAYNIGRPPVEAPTSLKETDFRLNPPQVLDLTVKKLNEKEELVSVQFGPDKRLGSTITINPAGAPVVLHDDGLAGDEKAGDHIYSATLPSEWDSLAAEQVRQLKELQRRNLPLSVPVFNGREVIGQQKIDLAELTRLRDAGIIKLLPFGINASDVVPSKSLFITDTNVVGDPSRTFNPCTGGGASMGKWTFGYLMTAMANQTVTGVDPSDFVMNWLGKWMTEQQVNGFAVPARFQILNLINRWPKLPNGKLDLSKAPMKLSAIVNRIDLAANSAYGAVGGAEGRFVFTVTGGNNNDMDTNSCFPALFTVILEYGVPIHDCEGLRNWAQQWLNLQNFALGSPDYNAALEAITEKFAAANADPSKPNGSALNQLRTDELFVGSPWELREFKVSASHQLSEVTVKQTPEEQLHPETAGPRVYFQGGFQNGDLVNWLNQNAAAIAANTYTVPDTLPFAPNSPFLGGASPNKIDFWNATLNTTPIVSEAVRHQFSLNTCNACHGAETRTTFRHVIDFANNGEAELSDFLTGRNMPVVVPVSSSTQTIPPNSPNPAFTYGDLMRRAQILVEDANANCLNMIRIPVLLSAH